MPPQTNTVLVVDDEPHVIYVSSHKLKQAGLAVVTANNGKHGYDIACEEMPAAIITDYQMPGGDGHELARRLYANEATAKIPVLLLTARVHKLNPSDLLDTNIHHIMEKPFSPTELMERVAEMLQHPDRNALTRGRGAA